MARGRTAFFCLRELLIVVFLEAAPVTSRCAEESHAGSAPLIKGERGILLIPDAQHRITGREITFQTSFYSDCVTT